MMKCVSGKNGYESKELAQEALIQHHVRKSHRKGTGPINIYLCSDCDEWHFTSKGAPADFLEDGEVKERIAREKRALDWERLF